MRTRRLAKSLINLAIIVPLLLNATPAFRLPFIETLERNVADIRLRATLPGYIDDRIVIADIDEASLAAIGRWPWNRDKLGSLVDTLFDHYGILVLGFDVLFAEPDESVALDVLDSLDRSPAGGLDEYQAVARLLKRQYEFDRQFASSLADRNVVLGYVFQQDEPVARNVLPDPMANIDGALLDRLELFTPAGFTGNLEALQSKAASAGFFDNPDFDVDGMVRRAPIIQAYGTALYPSLALAVTRAALDDPPINLAVFDDGAYAAIEQLQVGSLLIPLDASGSVTVPYLGNQGSFPYYSIAAILDKSLPKDALEGRVVLVGATAPGLVDLRTTPLSNAYPGVEVHANIISGILDSRIPMQPAWVIALELILLLLLAITMLVVPQWLGPKSIIALIAGIAAVVVAGNFYAWNTGLILPLASPLLMLLGVFMVNMCWGYLVEHRNRRSIKKLFGRYIPPAVVDEMAVQPDSISMEGQARDMTVLFADVRGFTSISEGLQPKELTSLMNELLTPLTRVIHDHGGTIDKYMGDAVMAFWGAPLEKPDHAHDGVKAAHAMIASLNELNSEFARRGWPEIKLGVGVNSGVMNVGNMGSEFRMAYTVLGDAVNLGSRLEGLTKQYGVPVIASENTKKATPAYRFMELDRVRVKGRDEPVSIHEPIAPRDELTDEQNDFIERFHKAISHYHEQNWKDAGKILHGLAADAEKPGRADWHLFLYLEYLRRIEDYKNSPPPDDWNGVHTHKSK
ncbi:MAG: adenylate/guanylate cyclase domain-containing protein [Gammaproteobacteria bacterium]|nr:adenylate/guanylate cyclase domain-containing protein [Gammaproteobacteria bacterium]NNF59846.1 adenylate/guanylate cyclase domain-containing protein [Gammaproteobacteria bacterium]NNM21280.1 adenylate/guanylate cyclase domain-containing protein [Gammaproteobacteria bacterium]